MVLKEFKISCAEVILREDVTVDQFIDVIEGNRAYIPVLYVFNKIDALTIEELDILDQMPNYVPISSQHQVKTTNLVDSGYCCHSPLIFPFVVVLISFPLLLLYNSGTWRS
jgi:ribosome-interacting GTPase 1